MFPLFYIDKDELNYYYDKHITSIPCQSILQYKKNLQDIKQRKSWKNSGSGAQFMGVLNMQNELDFSATFPTAMVIVPNNRMIYSACLDNGTAIYSKSLTDFQEAEALILRKNDFTVHDMAYDKHNNRLVLSASEAYSYQRHLSILAVDNNRIQYVTEGECLDANPVFDPNNSDIVYYDTCGFADDGNGFHIGPKEICRLNLKTGDLETILADANFDYHKPQFDKNGQLHVLRRPYKNKQTSNFSLKDLILAPVKLIKAIVNWLDLFTQRYTGESLKTTSGTNPAKSKPKSEEELFVEGNLIKVQQNVQKNIKMGEKFAGMIPNSWQLVKITALEEMIVLKKGVLSYALKDDHIVYSNGKYLLQIAPDQTETMLLESRLVNKIIC